MRKISNYLMGFISVLLFSSCMTTHKHNSTQINKTLLQEYFLYGLSYTRF